MKLCKAEEIMKILHDEIWSKGNISIIEDIFASNFIAHYTTGEFLGLDGVKSVVISTRESFPDWKEQIDDIIISGDKVTVRFTSSGTHQGSFIGVNPTGISVRITEIAIYRFLNGKIVEQWGVFDLFGLLNQIGAIEIKSKA